MLGRQRLHRPTSDVVREWAKTAPISTNLVYEATAGLAVARNAGMAAARGRLLAFTDDDCEKSLRTISALVAALFAGDKQPVMRGRPDRARRRTRPARDDQDGAGTCGPDQRPACRRLHSRRQHGISPDAGRARSACSIPALGPARRSAPARTPTMCTAPSTPVCAWNICPTLRSKHFHGRRELARRQEAPERLRLRQRGTVRQVPIRSPFQHARHAALGNPPGGSWKP